MSAQGSSLTQGPNSQLMPQADPWYVNKALEMGLREQRPEVYPGEQQFSSFASTCSHLGKT